MPNVTKIPCRLESVDVSQQLGGANQIYDDDLQSFQNNLNASYNNHIGDASIHITQQERNTWNNAVQSIPTKTSDLVNDSSFVTSEDLAQKEDKMPLINVTGTTLDASSGNYYRINNVGTLTITLPTITGSTTIQGITFMLICGSNVHIEFLPEGTETILYQDGFALMGGNTYEVSAIWNGNEWTLSRITYA